VAHHQSRRAEHVGLVNPGLDVDVRRQRSQARDVEATPRREKHAGIEIADSRQEGSEHVDRERHVTEDGAERHVEEWRVALGPPVRQRRADRRSGLAIADRPWELRWVQ
jgi:hypothetical protein